VLFASLPLHGWNTSPLLDFINVGAGGTTYEVVANIPTNGPNAIASNQWYHVAVTYSGVPNTPGNFNFYWTAMNPTNTSANLILSTNLTASLAENHNQPAFAIGNTGRNDEGNWLGEIDEVRISSVARGASGMMFALPSVSVTPVPNQFVAVGSTATLTTIASGGTPIGYQWQFNGTNITAANSPNISGATTNSLVISNITFAQAGTYTIIATNANSSNSTSAIIDVGAPVPGLFNTGVSAAGALLSGGSVDPNWQLVQSADPTYTGPNAIVDSTIPSTYIPDGPNSQWIAPGDNVSVAGGFYEYQTSFVLDSQNTNNMQLTVNWAADNVCVDILLNGVDLNISDGNGYTGFVPTIITNNFVAGSNTLICVISNSPGSGPNLSAFRAELSALSGPTPTTAVELLGTLSDATNYEYQSASFVATAYGSGPLSYQWYFGTNLLNGQTSRILNLSDVSPSQAGTYTVVIANSVSTNSESATLTVNTPDTLEWRGILTADWDLSTANWYDLTGLADVPFSQNANVVFDNNGSSQPVVNLDVPLSPNSVTVSSTVNYTFAGNGGYLAGNFNLLLNGPGTLIMDAPNTYTGNTIIQGGTLQLGNNDANGTLGSSAVSNNGVLLVMRTDTVTAPNRLSGSGQLNMGGSGTLILTGINSGFTGPTTVSSGILTPRNTYALGVGTTGATVLDGAQVYIDENINFPSLPMVLGGTGPGNGALHKGGGGSSYLGGPITLSDSAEIALDGSSSLYLTNPAAITGSNINLDIDCASSAVCTITGAVNLGPASLTEDGTGTIVLSSVSNLWTGGTTINSGTLQIGDGGNDGSIGNGAITDNGTLTYDTAASFTMTNQVSGGGAFYQSGPGRMVLQGGPLNNLSGAIHITGSGQLQLSNNESLTSGSLVIGATQADTNRLELTGNNAISIPISIFPRAFAGTITSTSPPTNYADIINLSGTNVVNSPNPITIASGGNLLALQSMSGYLIMSNGVTAAGGGRDFSLDGPAGGEVDGALIQNSGDSLNVWIVGTGLWFLNGQNSYTGTTIVSNGTLVINGTIASSPVTAYGGALGGIGTLTGPVVVAPGATLAPTLATGVGTPAGTLTVNNTLTLQAGSFTSLQINAAAATNDQIAGLTSVSFGGKLIVTNTSGALAAGNNFILFASAAYSGAFSSYALPPLSPGLAWSTGGLAVNGTLSVVTLTQPTFAPAVLSGTNLILSGSGGSPGLSYSVLTTTNLAAPLSAWSVAATGYFDVNGNFSVTNGIATGTSQRFYAVRTP
jgi:autotransporter-associated beta strand protein